MRVISLPQPWASLAVSGRLTWLARPQQTRHRGPLGIHARQRPGPLPADTRWRLSGPLPHGALLGMVVILDCRPIDLIPVDELDPGPFPAEPGWWAWEIGGARQWDPIPCRGGRGLFETEFVA